VYHHTVGFTLGYLGAGMILSGTLQTAFFASSLFRPVAFIGARSYSIYLWHVPMEKWVLPVLKHWGGAEDSAVWGVVYVVGSFAFGIAFAWLVESPVLRIREQLFPSRSSPQGVAAPDLRHGILAAEPA
jgi:peptidoglycan/LPS O-acetylase OafA/YrhL